MRSLAVSVFLLGVSALATAQSPAFEVVSIKRSGPDAGPGRAGPMPGGRYMMQNGPMRILLQVAYPTETNEIVNAPDWVTFENYDVMAVAGRDAPYPEMVEMLKTLLAQRLNLAAHVEMRDRPVYELVVATPGRLGPNLRPSTVDCNALAEAARARGELPQPAPQTGPLPQCSIRFADGLIEANTWSIRNIAGSLRSRTGRTVIDKTGLAGFYDLNLQFAQDPTNTADSRPTVFTAVQEQLGLRLQPAMAPLGVLVIDRIERPTEN